MTTIAADRKTMASDSFCSHGGLRTTAQKIYKVNGDLVGGAGALGELQKFAAWYQDRRKKAPDIQHTDILILTKEGDLYTYEYGEFVPCDDDFYSVGSGSYAAMAAMYMGADPVKAIEIASLVDDQTGGDIMTGSITKSSAKKR